MKTLFDTEDDAKYDAQFRIDSSGRRTQFRDLGFFRTIRHIKSIPPVILDLEVYFGLTCFGLAESMLSLLLLPVKGVIFGRRMTCREALSLYIMISSLFVYWICSSATTQLYSYLYHAVRRTSFIKLVMIFSILDVLDKALSSLAQDTLEVSYASWEGFLASHRVSNKMENSRKGKRKKRRFGFLSRANNVHTAPDIISPLIAPLDKPMDLAPHPVLSLPDTKNEIKETEDTRRSGNFSNSNDSTLVSSFHCAEREESPLESIEKPTSFSLGMLIFLTLTATFTVALHSLSLLLTAVTLNVSINADAHSLLALLVSNNFNELKSTIFKKYTPESLHAVCVVDAIERLQYIVLFFVISMQHISEKFNELAVIDGIIILGVEVFIDFAKLLFCCRFNGVPLSIFRTYTDLSVLDLASEKVLWKLPIAAVRVVRPAEWVAVASPLPVGKLDESIPLLLLPSFGFSSKNVKRAGFDALAYSSLLLWSLLRVVGFLCHSAPLVLLLSFVALCLLKLLLSSLVSGVAARFVLRTLLETKSRNEPTTTVQGKKRESKVPEGDRHTSDGFVLQLTPLLCALLKADRFDLQAGKKK